MEDDQAEQAIRHGRQAVAELQLTAKAFVRLRQAMFEKIAASPLDAQPLRERLYLSVQILDGVRAALLEAVADGEHANYTTTLATNVGLRPN